MTDNVKEYLNQTDSRIQCSGLTAAELLNQNTLFCGSPNTRAPWKFHPWPLVTEGKNRGPFRIPPQVVLVDTAGGNDIAEKRGDEKSHQFFVSGADQVWVTAKHDDRASGNGQHGVIFRRLATR
jgi:hypothetical protein